MRITYFKEKILEKFERNKVFYREKIEKIILKLKIEKKDGLNHLKVFFKEESNQFFKEICQERDNLNQDIITNKILLLTTFCNYLIKLYIENFLGDIEGREKYKNIFLLD